MVLSAQRRRNTYRPRLETLEDRLAPAVITVTTTADDLTPNDGSVSLREAITAINAGNTLGDPDIMNQNPGTFGVNDAINFNFAQPVVQTINVGLFGGGSLPAITKPLTINGYSQPGASANTLANGDNARILIELNGANAGPNADGLLLSAGAAGSTIQGLAINRFSLNGIELQSSGCVVAGNFVGTNPLGTVGEPNQADGIRISNGTNNVIGGTAPVARNIVSGNNLDGIHIIGTIASPATGNIVEGNFVGVSATGTGSVGLRPNGSSAGTAAGNFLFGIEVSGGTANSIGGASAAARNVIGFNLDGIEIDNGAQNNVVEANFIGIGADGVTASGNIQHGIAMRSSDNLAAPLVPGQANEPAVSGNIIGLVPASLTGLGNIVAFNGTGGVAIFGNPSLNNATKAQNSGNSILGNSIFQNGRSNPASLLGIDLTNQFVYPTDDGSTPNDTGKNLQGQPAPHGDVSNPNNFENAPILTSVTQVTGGIQIVGTFTQTVSPNTTFRIEFFVSNPGAGVPEGQTFVGAANVTTDGNGKTTISTMVNSNPAPGQLITATATNITTDPSTPPGSVSLFNTSEFSAPVTVALAVPTITSLTPGSTTEGTIVTITITGTNFAGSSTVQVNGSAVPTTFISSTQLQATLPASATTDEGTPVITVVNPAPGGGVSNQVFFPVLESPLPDGSRGTPNQRFVSELYHDLLQRPVDASGLAVWSAQLDQGVSRTQVATAIEGSQEYRTLQVQTAYQKFLHRAADSSGLTTFLNFLNNGGTVEQMDADIAGSQEYFQVRGGGTNDGFLNAFYADVLNRAVDASGRAAWDQAFAMGETTMQVALAILGSNEYRQDLVQSIYLQFLDRNADSGGLAAFVNLLNSGARDEAVIAMIAGSGEFFAKTAS